MEREYDLEFDLHAPKITPSTSTQNRELETVGSTTPSTLSQDNLRSLKRQGLTAFLLSDVKVEYKANCKYCNNTHYKVNSRYGTSNGKRHIDNCAAYKTFLAQNPSHVTTFDQRVLVRMFVEVIMYHLYPCSMVEHVKLREILSYLNPQVRHVTRNTILRYFWLEHLRLKYIFHETLSHLNSRSRILNFCYFPPPHRGVDIYLFVVPLIKEWSLERKAFSITCDNVGAMDVMVARLKSDLLSFGTLPVASRFIHCQSGMKVIDNSILKHREAINYIVASDARLCTFEKCVLDSKCNFAGKLRLYCPTRWNSTYLMLKRALTSEQWTIVQFVCRFLGPFHSITELFSGSDYPTANLYFANVLAIEKLLVLVNNHKIDSIRKKASVMLEKFEKHWGDYSTLFCNSRRT
ncbi:putative AC transposase [Bienertia sinuspersici]